MNFEIMKSVLKWELTVFVIGIVYFVMLFCL